MTATNKPERAESEGEEEKGCSRVSMRVRGSGPFNCDGFGSRWRVQSEDNIANWPRREPCVYST